MEPLAVCADKLTTQMSDWTPRVDLRTSPRQAMRSMNMVVRFAHVARVAVCGQLVVTRGCRGVKVSTACVAARDPAFGMQAGTDKFHVASKIPTWDTVDAVPLLVAREAFMSHALKEARTPSNGAMN